MIRRHFESSFADQQWIVYDIRSNYGLCYDTRRTCEVRLDIETFEAYREPRLNEERLCQTLWRRDHVAVNFEARNNPRLHLSRLPRRYWRFLTEKQIR